MSQKIKKNISNKSVSAQETDKGDLYCTISLNNYDKKDTFNLTYEECVEIFSEFKDKQQQSRFTGNEYHESAMKKAEQIFKSLPTTDY